MTNEEFLRRLESALVHRLPPEELEDVMNYHREYFAEAGESAADGLDAPETIAQRVLEEHLSEQPPIPPRRNTRRIALAAGIVAALAVGIVVTALVWHGTGHFFSRVFGDGGDTGNVEEDVIEQVTVVDTGLAAGAWDEGEAYLETTVPESRFDKLIIDVPCADVTVMAGDGGIQSSAPQGFTLRNTLEKGVLRYTGTAPKDVRVTDERPMIAIFLPVDLLELEEIDIEVELGDIYLEGGTTWKVDAETENGSVTVRDWAATDEATFSAKLGMVDMTGSFPCVVELDSEMGGVSAVLTGDRSDYGLELSTDWGDITVDGEAVSREHVVRSGPYQLSAECDTGDISIDFVE